MLIDLPVLHGACTLPLTQGKSALVDAADYPELSRHRWHASRNRRGGRFYAVRYVRVGGRRQRVVLHRLLAGDPPGLAVDHASADSLDNRRSNVRPASRFDNGANQGKRHRRHGTTSRWKGVSRNVRGKPWQSSVCRGRGRFHLGVYSTEAEAAVAYDCAARLLFAEFARTNDTPPGQAPPPARRIAIAHEVERRMARAGRGMRAYATKISSPNWSPSAASPAPCRPRRPRLGRSSSVDGHGLSVRLKSLTSGV